MTYEGRDSHFLFGLNRDRFEAMVAAGRWITLLFGLVLGWLLWRITLRGSAVFCFLTLALWAFEPNLLAFSGLVLSDIPFACCFLGAVWAFSGRWKSPLYPGPSWPAFSPAWPSLASFRERCWGPAISIFLELFRRFGCGKKPEKIPKRFRSIPTVGRPDFLDCFCSLDFPFVPARHPQDARPSLALPVLLGRLQFHSLATTRAIRFISRAPWNHFSIGIIIRPLFYSRALCLS